MSCRSIATTWLEKWVGNYRLFMVMILNDEERKAIGRKLDNEKERVICPRCGNELIFERRGYSIAIECKTENCIRGGLRGL